MIGLFGRLRSDTGLTDEIRTHLDLLTEAHVRVGMPLEAARAAARRDFGGVEQIKEQYREQRGLPYLETLHQDLRYAWRPAVSLAGLHGRGGAWRTLSRSASAPRPASSASSTLRLSSRFHSAIPIVW